MHKVLKSNLGHKFIPTPGVCNTRAVIDLAMSKDSRCIMLRSYFGSKDTSAYNMKYHVPRPGFMPSHVPQPVISFIQDVSAALKSCYDAQSVLMRARPMRDNMPLKMRHALVELQNDPNIIVKPSDKNMGLCILDAAWYVAECNRQLSDPATYASVMAAAMLAIIQQLQHKARQLAQRWQPMLPEQVYAYIMEHASAASQHVVPFFYLLPKVHKLLAISRAFLHQLKGRPIAACHSWVTNAISVYLADVLNKVCFQQFPQVLPDTKTLVKLLESSTISRDAYLVTFDVESMYPSINNVEAVAACRDAVTLSRSAVHGSMVEDLLTFVLNHGYCQFGGSCYKQVQGTVMGTPVAPPYSNIYIAAKLEAVVQQHSAYWPEIYKRFIDDGFCVWQQDYASLMAFLQALNSTLPNIRLTWKISQTSIDYMDITISKCMDTAGPTVGL